MIKNHSKFDPKKKRNNFVRVTKYAKMVNDKERKKLEIKKQRTQ